MGVMIVDYMILSGWFVTLPKFENLVRQSIADGWQPLGGISVQLWEDKNGQRVTSYAQAMVKYADGYGGTQ